MTSDKKVRFVLPGEQKEFEWKTVSHRRGRRSPKNIATPAKGILKSQPSDKPLIANVVNELKNTSARCPKQIEENCPCPASNPKQTEEKKPNEVSRIQPKQTSGGPKFSKPSYASIVAGTRVLKTKFLLTFGENPFISFDNCVSLPRNMRPIEDF